MLTITKDFIPQGSKRRPGRPMDPNFITVHNTGNAAKGAGAKSHANYLKNNTGDSTGWHFTVDEAFIIQHIPTSENAYHAGDGANGPGNKTSIGIEICENVDGFYGEAEANAIELIRYLMLKYGIPIENVVPHKHWTGKNCPHLILPRWGEFIGQVQPKKPKNVVEYAVQPGDYLRKIANKFGIILDELLAINPQIKDPSLIQVGDVIWVPAPKPDPYKNVPEWARAAVKKACEKGLISEPLGDTTFYRLLTVMDKLTLFD